MKKKMLLLVVILVLASLALSACGSAAKTDFPTGKFIKSGETEYGLKFNADGTFEVFQGESTYVTSTYKVDGDVFTETSNDGGCETNVSFNYTFDGSKLTFKYVGDPAKDADCAGRYADFAALQTACSAAFEPPRTMVKLSPAAAAPSASQNGLLANLTKFDHATNRSL